MRSLRIPLISFLLLILCGGAVYAALQSSAPGPAPLASYAPPGALLAIESPDFASVLAAWTHSSERKRWLAGDNYAGFSRSRLFDRLSQAQDEFATTAGLPPDSNFLQQIAGRQSLLAWYDIGNLEFLYITRLPPGDAAKTPLLQLRDRFEQRKAGDATFFVRTQQEPARTVAFAVQGDYLLLATREDLLAGALELLQHPAAATSRTLLNDTWYATTIAAASKTPGDLRMTLNLAKIVRSPYFRSYWIQQNVSETKQYIAALSDLYRSPDALREERVLIPADPDTQPQTSDLSSVLDLVPPGLGVYRAQSAPTTADILTQFEDKLLSRRPTEHSDTHIAPQADLSTPESGTSTNLEQRIDEPTLPAQPREQALTALRTLFSSATPTSLLSFSTVDPAPSTFTPIHTAVALTAAAPWSPTTLQQALTAALLPRLSSPGTSLQWTQRDEGGSSSYSLEGPQSLTFALIGNTCVLASDYPTLHQLLSAQRTATHSPASPPPSLASVTVLSVRHFSISQPRSITPPRHPPARPRPSSPATSPASARPS